MDEKKKDVTAEEEKVEPIKEETAKEEPIVQPEEPKQKEQAEEQKEEPQRPVVDLDYDKLGQLIETAIQKTHEPKKDQHLNNLACVFSWILGGLEAFFAVLILYVMIKAKGDMNWNSVGMATGNVIAYMLYCAFMVIVGLVAFWTIRIAIKIHTEQDRNYTVAVFSSLATFAAVGVAVLSIMLGK